MKLANSVSCLVVIAALYLSSITSSSSMGMSTASTIHTDAAISPTAGEQTLVPGSPHRWFAGGPFSPSPIYPQSHTVVLLVQ